MAEMTLQAAEDALRHDGRYGWLLSGRQVWSVAEIVEQYTTQVGVPVSHDTVTRWAKQLAPEGGAENYGGTIGWRVRRDALIRFLASGRHLRRAESEPQDAAG